MRQRRSLRQRLQIQIKERPVATMLNALLAAIIVLIILSILGYIFNWEWTGLAPYTSPPHSVNSNYQPGKTLWDWLQLLIIPVVLAIGGYLFNYEVSKNERKAADQHNQTEREIASDNQREQALQAYIDKMSELLLHEKLRESNPKDEIRNIARVRTLTVLPRLDGNRKGSVLGFLYESGLIDKDQSIVDLQGANLNEADLEEADLHGAMLHKVDLRGAKLWDANLHGTDLSEADLSALYMGFRRGSLKTNLGGADLSEANLTGADLWRAQMSKANLTGANLAGADFTYANLVDTKVTTEQLEKAKALAGATLPDGSKLPDPPPAKK